jgi:hypothetical protein
MVEGARGIRAIHARFGCTIKKRAGKPMTIRDEPDSYQTYVLRLWRARCQGKWELRASIESPHTGERHVFAGLMQLFAFLSERCECQEPEAPQEE